MKRGDIVIATGPGFGGKPRPNLVIQADDYLSLPTLILLPIASDLADPPSLLRVRVEPDEANGLRDVSDVMTDVPITTRPDKGPPARRNAFARRYGASGGCNAAGAGVCRLRPKICHVRDFEAAKVPYINAFPF